MTEEDIEKLSLEELKKLQSKLISDINLLDIRQYCLKIALNSFYGSITSKVSPLGDDRMGNSVCVTGQKSIKEVNNFIRQYVKDNYYHNISDKESEELIVFNDTDSVGISLSCLNSIGITICSNGKVTERGMEIIQDIAQATNKHIEEWSKNEFNTNTCTLELKLEKICDFGIYRKKKNYALHIIYDEGKVDEKTGELKTKWGYTGIELAKSILTSEIKELGKKVIEPMILKQDKATTDKLLREAYEKFKELPLSVTCQIKVLKTFNKYVQECKGFKTAPKMQSHIKAGYFTNKILELENVRDYKPIEQGESCQILPVKPNNKYRVTHVAFRHNEYPEIFDELFEPNYKEIFEKPFYACISSLYDVCGWICPQPSDEYAFNLFDLFD